MGQRDQPVRQIQFNTNVWVAANESFDVRTDVLAPQRHRRGDAHQATNLRGEITRFSDAAGDEHKALSGLFDQVAAGFCQTY